MPSPSLSLSNQELQITETGQSSELPVIMEESIQLQDHWVSGTARFVDEPLAMSEEYSDYTLTMVSSSSTCEQAPQVVQNSIKSNTSEENLTTVTVPLSVSIDVWTTPNTSPSNSTASIELFNIASQIDQTHMSLHPPPPSVMSHHSHFPDMEARTGRDMNNIDHPIQELKHSEIESSTLFTCSTQLSVHSIGGHVNSKLLNSNKSSNDANTENTSQHYQEGQESNHGSIDSVSFHHSKSMLDTKDECLYEAYLPYYDGVYQMSDSVALQVEALGMSVESVESNKLASLQPSNITPQTHPSHTTYYYQKRTAVNIDCDECMDGPVCNTSIIKSASEVSCQSVDYYSAYETLEFSS